MSVITAGFVCVISGVGAHPYPAWGIVAICGCAFATALVALRKSDAGPFSYVMLAVWSAPFLPFVDLGLFGAIRMDGLTPLANAAIGNEAVLTRAAHICATSLFGLAIGFSLGGDNRFRDKIRRSGAGSRQIVATLPAWLYAIIAISVVVYYQLIVPSGTILSGSYEEVMLTDSLAGGLAFAGATLFIEIIFAALLLDVIRCRRGPETRVKWYVFACTLCYFVVFQNLLRGMRGASGIVLAVLIIYFLKNEQARRVLFARKWALGCIGVLLFVVFFSLGYLRFALVTGSVDYGVLLHSFATFYKSGTWCGAFLSTIGISDVTLAHSFDWLHGNTYKAYALSLPPSFVTNLLHYSRPLDDVVNDPQWWFNLGTQLNYGAYTTGGTHPAMVAYANFGLLGSLLCGALYGTLFQKVSSFVISNRFGAQLLFGSFLVAAFHLCWYSEMAMVRALMATAVVYGLFKVLVTLAK